MKTLRIGTWNIAAARRLQSKSQLDYSAEDAGYFAEQIRRTRLDVICLQESHYNKRDSLARRLADLAGMPHVAETPGCPSHIDQAYLMGNAILSRLPFESPPMSRLLPQARFELSFSDSGKPARPFDRYLLEVAIHGVQVATLHTEPLERFGRSYQQAPGVNLARDIDAELEAYLKSPVVLAGDCNTDLPAAALIKNTSATLGLKEVFQADSPTTPWQTQPDHMFCSPELHVVESGITQTQTDHFLLWAEVQYT